MAQLEHLSIEFVPFKKEADVLRTIDIIFENIHPSNPHWHDNLRTVVETFFVKDKRTKVRQTVLAVVKQMYDSYRVLCGEELIEKIFLQFLGNIFKDPDPLIRGEYVMAFLIRFLLTVRCRALDVIVDIAKSTNSDVFFRLADVLDKATK